MMRVLPRSLTGRLLVMAIAAMCAALILIFFVLGEQLHGFVSRGLDAQLDAQILLLSRQLTAAGTVGDVSAFDFPPYSEKASGWGWEVVVADRRIRSASLGTAVFLPPDWERRAIAMPDSWPALPLPGGMRPVLFDGMDASGRATHFRVIRAQTTRGLVTIVAGAPGAVVEGFERMALPRLLAALLLLGLMMAAALILLLRVGLRPLDRLQHLVDEVGRGRRRQIEVDEPTELLPLVRALNGLIAASETALARARGHVANLAHGLKTPLATLHLDLEASGADPEGRLLTQVTRMEGQIRHHLGRARAADLATAPEALSSLQTCVTGLVGALTRIYADRGVVAEVHVPDHCELRCDPQDLDELFGNLLDNAWRWARARVRISTASLGRHVAVTIEDDGPGMSQSGIDAALSASNRQDEKESGHGFGLSISRELAELHGGSLSLGRSQLGGLEVTVQLLLS